MNERLTILSLEIIACLVAVLVGILEGNGAVFFFNRIPAEWFCDYGEKPTAEMLDRSTQRVKSYPWKYVFTMGFIILNIKMVTDDWQFAIPGTIALWLLLELSISDIKYQIVPDQLLILLTVTGLGFMPYRSTWKEAAFGAAIGFGLMFIIALIGKLTYKRDTIGGGDIKLFTILGFISGPIGFAFIFVVSTLLSAGHFVYLLAKKRVKATDARPMVPFISVAAALHIVFFWDTFTQWLI